MEFLAEEVFIKFSCIPGAFCFHGFAYTHPMKGDYYMLKRFLSLLVALLMTLGCAVAETAVEVESVSHQIAMKVVPF